MLRICSLPEQTLGQLRDPVPLGKEEQKGVAPEKGAEASAIKRGE